LPPCVTTSNRGGKRLRRVGANSLGFDKPGGAWQSTRLIGGGSPLDIEILSVFAGLG
jgi:hypothetical protein